MPELNVDVPIIQCLVRRQYLYNQERGFDEYEPCVVFGACSIPGRALTFHCLLENGAQITRLPISAFCTHPHGQYAGISQLELWDCFSYHITCHEYAFLKNCLVVAFPSNNVDVGGNYLCTFDWHSSNLAENPGDVGFKQAHLIRLDDGNFCLMPNNRICWREPSFVDKPFDAKTTPDYITNSWVWSAENGSYQLFHK